MSNHVLHSTAFLLLLRVNGRQTAFSGLALISHFSILILHQSSAPETRLPSPPCRRVNLNIAYEEAVAIIVSKLKLAPRGSGLVTWLPHCLTSCITEIHSTV